MAALVIPSSGAPPPPVFLPPSGRETPIHRGEAWVDGRFIDVACARAGDAYVLRAAGLPTVMVRRSGCAVAAAAPGVVTAALAELLIGPGLILALALDGAFSLHAAAVLVDGGSVLLAGTSGAGKSTLARALAEAGADRIADDVLPCEVAGPGAWALPHYPQLKLRAAEQYAVERPSRVPLRAICLLEGDRDAVEGTVFERLAPREAALAVAAHTVAARLFDAPLLEAHLGFCAAVTAAVPVRRVRFRKRLDALPALVADVLADAVRRD